jgi:hypothetical protein
MRGWIPSDRPARSFRSVPSHVGKDSKDPSFQTSAGPAEGGEGTSAGTLPDGASALAEAAGLVQEGCNRRHTRGPRHVADHAVDVPVDLTSRTVPGRDCCPVPQPHRRPTQIRTRTSITRGDREMPPAAYIHDCREEGNNWATVSATPAQQRDRTTHMRGNHHDDAGRTTGANGVGRSNASHLPDFDLAAGRRGTIVTEVVRHGSGWADVWLRSWADWTHGPKWTIEFVDVDRAR